MDIVVIGDQHTLTGFRLAGVTKAYGIKEGKENIHKILTDDAVGVLIMTERFAEENHMLIEGHLSSKKMTPIVVEIPDVSGPIPKEVDPIKELIKRAIGTEVK